MMGKIGIVEMVLILVPLALLLLVYMVGKKVGYGKALRDVAEGKFPALSSKNQKQ